MSVRCTMRTGRAEVLPRRVAARTASGRVHATAFAIAAGAPRARANPPATPPAKPHILKYLHCVSARVLEHTKLYLAGKCAASVLGDHAPLSVARPWRAAIGPAWFTGRPANEPAYA